MCGSPTPSQWAPMLPTKSSQWIAHRRRNGSVGRAEIESMARSRDRQWRAIGPGNRVYGSRTGARVADMDEHIPGPLDQYASRPKELYGGVPESLYGEARNQ